MFTGIIEELAEVINIKKSNNFYEIDILSKFSNRIKIGDSISLNGVCLTVINVNHNYFTVNIVRETLIKSSLKYLKNKTFINLERALKVSSRIDGHIVQGHVEAVGKIVKREYKDKQTDFTIEIKKDYMKYCINKGSVALDGISLTISNIVNNKIIVSIIPHTLENTNLKYKEVDDKINLETDMFAKYVENIILSDKQK